MLAAGRQIAAALGDQKPVSPRLASLCPRRGVLLGGEHMSQRSWASKYPA